MQALSIIISLYLTPGFSAATCLTTVRNSPSVCFLQDCKLQGSDSLLNVCFVNSCDLLSTVSLCVLKGKICYSSRRSLCSNLQTLYYAGFYSLFETTIF